MSLENISSKILGYFLRFVMAFSLTDSAPFVIFNALHLIILNEIFTDMKVALPYASLKGEAVIN